MADKVTLPHDDHPRLLIHSSDKTTAGLRFMLGSQAMQMLSWQASMLWKHKPLAQQAIEPSRRVHLRYQADTV